MGKKIIGIVITVAALVLIAVGAVILLNGNKTEDKPVDVNKPDDSYDKDYLYLLYYDFDKLGEVKYASINGTKSSVELKVTDYNNDALFYYKGKIYYYGEDRSVHTYDISSKKDESIVKLDNVDYMKGNDKYIYYFSDKVFNLYDVSKKNSKKLNIEVNPDNVTVYNYKEYLAFVNDKGIFVYNAKKDKVSNVIEEKGYSIDFNRSYNNILVYKSNNYSNRTLYYYNITNGKTTKYDNKDTKVEYLNKYNGKEFNIDSDKITADKKEYMKLGNDSDKIIHASVNDYIYVLYEMEMDHSSCLKGKDDCFPKVKSTSYSLLNIKDKKYDKLS